LENEISGKIINLAYIIKKIPECRHPGDGVVRGKNYNFNLIFCPKCDTIRGTI